MQQASDQWKRTWACAIGQTPVDSSPSIDAHLLLWCIDRERWEMLDSSTRATLVSRRFLSSHRHGWGEHPDLVVRRTFPYGRIFRFWNPDAPLDDLQSWAYADRLRAQSTFQDAQEMIALLDTLSPDRSERFTTILDRALLGYDRSE